MLECSFVVGGHSNIEFILIQSKLFSILISFYYYYFWLHALL